MDHLVAWIWTKQLPSWKFWMSECLNEYLCTMWLAWVFEGNPRILLCALWKVSQNVDKNYGTLSPSRFASLCNTPHIQLQRLRFGPVRCMIGEGACAWGHSRRLGKHVRFSLYGCVRKSRGTCCSTCSRKLSRAMNGDSIFVINVETKMKISSLQHW